MSSKQRGIIIGGTPRSGKSILGKKLSAALGWTLVHGDSIVGAFEEVFPALAITHDGPTLDSICDAFEPWAFRYMERLSYYRIPFVFESYHLRPQSLYQQGVLDKYLVLYLGYPEADVEEKFRDVRDNSSEPDWMAPLSDDVVKDYIERFKGTSLYFQNRCEQHGIQFIDLSREFEKRLAGIVEKIAGEIGRF